MKTDGEKRNKKIDLRLTDKEFNTLNALCKKANITRSSYILQAVLDGKVLTSIDAQMIFQIRKMGVNLNQIAKVLHIISKFSDNTDSKISDIFEKISDINNQLQLINDHIYHTKHADKS